MSGHGRDQFRKYISGSEKRKKKLREEFQKKQRGTFDKYVFWSNEIINEENALISKLDETDDRKNVENNSIENESNCESDNINTDKMFNVDKNMTK